MRRTRSSDRYNALYQRRNSPTYRCQDQVGRGFIRRLCENLYPQSGWMEGVAPVIFGITRYTDPCIWRAVDVRAPYEMQDSRLWRSIVERRASGRRTVKDRDLQIGITRYTDLPGRCRSKLRGPLDSLA